MGLDQLPLIIGLIAVPLASALFYLIGRTSESKTAGCGKCYALVELAGKAHGIHADSVLFEQGKAFVRSRIGLYVFNADKVVILPSKTAIRSDVVADAREEDPS